MSSIGQNCTCVLSGHIADTDTKDKLPGATILIKETKQTAVADKNGFFQVANLCPGNYSFLITHTGCDLLEITVRMDSSRQQDFKLPHHRNELAEVKVTGEKRQEIATNARSELKGIQLFQTSGQTLGESLKGVPGLNIIQKGPSISKPVIHDCIATGY